MAAERRHQKQWRFYETDAGRKVAREELDALEPHGKAALAEAMRRYRSGEEFAHEVSSIGDGLRELRVSVGNDPFRLIFAAQGRYSQVLLVVRVFYKNSRKLPKADRDLALDRLKAWKRRSHT